MRKSIHLKNKYVGCYFNCLSQRSHQYLHRLPLSKWRTWSQTPTRIQSDPYATLIWILQQVQLLPIQNRPRHKYIHIGICPACNESPHDTYHTVGTARFLNLPLDDLDHNQTERGLGNRYNINNMSLRREKKTEREGNRNFYKN